MHYFKDLELYAIITMSLYYLFSTKMADAVGLWVIVLFCVTLVNTKDYVKHSFVNFDEETYSLYNDNKYSKEPLMLVTHFVRQTNLLLICSSTK